MLMADMAASIWSAIKSYLDWFYFPKMSWTDVLDILLISYLLYHILLWLKTSRAWTLLRGVAIIALFLGLAALLRLNTILWNELSPLNKRNHLIYIRSSSYNKHCINLYRTHAFQNSARHQA